MTPRHLLLFAASVAFCATAAHAQGSSSTPATIAATSDQPAKKVWTNDDLSGSNESFEPSTPASPKLKPVKTGQKPPPTNGRDAKWYHDQIAKLESQVPPLDRQIGDLQSALDGKPTGDGQTSQRPRGVKLDDWSSELTQLQAKRVDLLSKIDALRDQARRNGIPDSTLP